MKGNKIRTQKNVHIPKLNFDEIYKRNNNVKS